MSSPFLIFFILLACVWKLHLTYYFTLLSLLVCIHSSIISTRQILLHLLLIEVNLKTIMLPYVITNVIHFGSVVTYDNCVIAEREQRPIIATTSILAATMWINKYFKFSWLQKHASFTTGWQLHSSQNNESHFSCLSFKQTIY